MNVKQWVAFGLLSLIWGSSFLLIKIGLKATDPFTLVFLRVFLGAVILWGVIHWRRINVPATVWLCTAMLLLGLFNNAIPFTLITWGEQTIPSGLAAVLNGSMPLFTAVFAHLVLADEGFTIKKTIGLVLGFGGVLLVVRGGSQEISWNALMAGDLGGQLAVIGASICYAGCTVFVRKFLQEVNPFVLAAMQLTGASLFMPVGVALWEWPVPFAMKTGPVVAVAVLGVVNTGGAYLLYFYLVREAGATRTSLVTYLIPAIGLIFGIVFLAEPLRIVVVAGLLVILTGVFLVDRGGGD